MQYWERENSTDYVNSVMKLRNNVAEGIRYVTEFVNYCKSLSENKVYENFSHRKH